MQGFKQTPSVIAYTASLLYPTIEAWEDLQKRLILIQLPQGYLELLALAKYKLQEQEGLAFPATAPIQLDFYETSLQHWAAIAQHLPSYASLFQDDVRAHLSSCPFKDTYEVLVAWGAASPLNLKKRKEKLYFHLGVSVLERFTAQKELALFYQFSGVWVIICHSG